jgi:hypothetical protein
MRVIGVFAGHLNGGHAPGLDALCHRPAGQDEPDRVRLAGGLGEIWHARLRRWENERMKIASRRQRAPGREPPARQWFQAEDGTYYRNYPLIRDERQAVLAWPDSAPGKYEIFSALLDEGRQVMTGGVLRKAALGPGDVVAEPAPFRKAYPRNPGLWMLDDR